MTTTQVKATIKSEKQITLKNLDKFTEAISYKKKAEVNFDGVYYTEIRITIDLEKAKEDFDEYMEGESEEDKKEWTGNIWDWLEDGPECRMNEDGVLPDGWKDEVEIEYL